ncbi:MAG: glycosyltransferase [Deltaproteobacteria bacterium]|nr:glycosyltransferase [Deltaproteobacteria bacterium]
MIPTKDRPSELRAVLHSLDAQTARPDAIWIVASGRPVAEVGAAFPRLPIHYLHHARPSASAQRNVGARAARGADLIGFFDDDIVLEPDALEGMLAFWRAAAADVGGAALNLLNFEPPPARALKRSTAARWLGLYDPAPGKITPSGWQTLIGTVTETTQVDWLPSTACIWRAETLQRVAFEERFDGYSYLEDLDFSLEVGKSRRLFVVAEAGFRHHPSDNGRVSRYRFGQSEVDNRLYIVRKHGLSAPLCYLGLSIRMLMTGGSFLFRPTLGDAQRLLGNWVGLGRSIGGFRSP